MDRSWIAEHVYVSVGKGAVFLDVRRDLYFEVEATQIRNFGAVVVGWPIHNNGSAAQATIAVTEVCEMVNSLITEGLLTRDPAHGKRVTEIRLACPKRPIIADSDLQAPVVIRFRHIANFLRAYLMTLLTLRLISLSCALERLTAISARQGFKPTPSNLDEARELVSIFKRLRLLTYTAKSKCLFDSIAMLRFLSAYKIFPTLVIGVQTSPFLAHCWLQEGDIAFNCEPTDTENYSPILTIPQTSPECCDS
jgi:hypothetical protein